MKKSSKGRDYKIFVLPTLPWHNHQDDRIKAATRKDRLGNGGIFWGIVSAID